MNKILILILITRALNFTTYGQSEVITFEHIGFTHSGIYSYMLFKDKTEPIRYHAEQIWAFDSLRATTHDKLDSLLQTYSSEVSNGKDTTKFGTYKISSILKDGTIKFSYYVYGIEPAIDFFKWLSCSVYKFPDSEGLSEMVENIKYMLEVKKE